MNTTSERVTKKIRVTSQQFTAHNSKPEEGKGFVSFQFEDNRKKCLCEPNETVCWQASFKMKAVSGTKSKPNPSTDLLLMEAGVTVDAEFCVKKVDSADALQSMAWYFDEVCKQKMLSKMQLLLIDTEFANIPFPGNV